MLAWLWNLIVGNFCKHTWKEEEEIPVYWGDNKRPYKFIYIQKCSKCFDRKTKRIKG